MNETGWSADAARGHDHPDSEAARSKRIEDAKADARLARTGLALAQGLLRRYARTDRDVADTLHSLATGLDVPIVKSTDVESLIQLLDEMADEIDQPGAV